VYIEPYSESCTQHFTTCWVRYNCEPDGTKHTVIHGHNLVFTKRQTAYSISCVNRTVEIPLYTASATAYSYNIKIIAAPVKPSRRWYTYNQIIAAASRAEPSLIHLQPNRQVLIHDIQSRELKNRELYVTWFPPLYVKPNKLLILWTRKRQNYIKRKNCKL